MIELYQKTIKDTELKTLDSFKVGSWVYAENPTSEELQRLSDEFGLEEGVLYDAVDPHEVPRLEIEDGVIYTVTRFAYEEENRVITVPVLIAIGSDFIATVSLRPLPFIDKFRAGKITFSTTQKTKLFLQLFSEINATYHRYLAATTRRVRRIGVDVDSVSNQDISQFVSFEHVLNDFTSALVPTHEILRSLLKGKALTLYEEDEDLVEDLMLGTDQLIKMATGTIKMIRNIREAYSTIMTNNLNRVMRFLAALTVILTIPMIITGLYGMNVALPLQDTPAAFWIILGITALIAGILIGIFSAKRWL